MPGSSSISRTTSKILGVGPWKAWAPRMHSFAAIQLEEMQAKKAGAKAKDRQNDISKKPAEQWTTAPETQGIVDEVEKAVRFSFPTTQSIEIGGKNQFLPAFIIYFRWDNNIWGTYLN